MRFSILLALLTICCGAAGAQQRVTFAILPTTAFVKVAGQVLELREQKSIELEPGVYKIELWAPEFEIKEVTINVPDDRPMVVRENLRTLSTEYEAFRAALRANNNKKFERTIKDISLTGLTAGLAYGALKGRREELDNLKRQIESFPFTYQQTIDPATLNALEEEYDLLLDEHGSVQRKHNTRVVVLGVLAGAGVAVLIKRFVFTKRERYRRPIYEARNPFLAERGALPASLEISPRSSGFGLTLKF